MTLSYAAIVGLQGENRTLASWFCRPTPSHLATWRFGGDEGNCSLLAEGYPNPATVHLLVSEQVMPITSPRARMTGIEPVTTCIGNKCSIRLSYILIGSIDGSCTRFSLAENQSDFSIRPRCYKAGMDGFVACFCGAVPTIFRSTGDCFEPN